MNERQFIFDLIAYCQRYDLLSTDENLYDELEEITDISKEEIKEFMED